MSEFDRYDPYGAIVPQDQPLKPREILSPAVPRNGHLTLHIVVSGPSKTNYFLYVLANPPGILAMTLYREHWSPCGFHDCGDWVTPLASPAFGAIPESITERQAQSTRNYLLDIYVPPDVPPRRVRVEALLKVGIWYVAPMEVRVIEPSVPDMRLLSHRDDIPGTGSVPASERALGQLLRYTNGLPPALPRQMLRVGDFIQRNAAEDLWLAHAYRGHFPELNLMSFFPLLYPLSGAEWFLRVRDFIYRLE